MQRLCRIDDRHDIKSSGEARDGGQRRLACSDGFNQAKVHAPASKITAGGTAKGFWLTSVATAVLRGAGLTSKKSYNSDLAFAQYDTKRRQC
jgi:hypothetical protein